MLDTNICIYIINARPPAVLARFRKEHLGSIGISSVTAAELAFGVAKSGSARNHEALEMFLATLEIMPFDASTIWHYGELRAELERRGQPIGALDTMIAAHALAANTILVTNNTREFVRVPALRLQNWAEE
ncbi:type II toxin-antitoxin system tRNA(fMet)-specific endonuclease VapC [Sulfuriferula thiophila]|uniref:type II toxin-antitoxin system tRNA(fMet)-specific endonuclease VapC n=1 Tax=Sulfuriferula thiophila TaxID=1781211 RepID=UPI001CB94240|nr:type II toxin-antitoxin system VapC family toxin [Sulfuriferula thiophila]